MVELGLYHKYYYYFKSKMKWNVIGHYPHIFCMLYVWVIEKPDQTAITSPIRDMNVVIGNWGSSCTFIFL